MNVKFINKVTKKTEKKSRVKYNLLYFQYTYLWNCMSSPTKSLKPREITQLLSRQVTFTCKRTKLHQNMYEITIAKKHLFKSCTHYQNHKTKSSNLKQRPFEGYCKCEHSGQVILRQSRFSEAVWMIASYSQICHT